MITEPCAGDELLRAALLAAPRVAYFLPRNVRAGDVGALRPAGAGEGGVHSCTGGAEALRCELEEQYVGDKLKTTTAYFGPFEPAAVE